MPSIFKNKQPVKLVLKGDMKEAPQPTFLTKRLTFGEMKLFMHLMETFGDTENIAKTFDTLEATLEEVIIGWENMGPYVFGEDKLGEFLDAREVMELTHLVLGASNVSGDEGN